MIALGAALLICALLLFLYAFFNFPKTKEATGSFNRRPTVAGSTQIPKPSPSAVPFSANKPQQKAAPVNSRQHASRVFRRTLSPASFGASIPRSTDRVVETDHKGADVFKRQYSDKAPSLQNATQPSLPSVLYSSTPETTATPGVQPASSQQTSTRISASPQQQQQTAKPNIFRRFINWLKSLFKGRPKSGKDQPNQPPVVTLAVSSTSIRLPCPPNTSSQTCTPSPNQQVQLTANATDPDGDTLLYSYNVSGGRITGEGPNVTWDLTGVQPGTYTANVEVDDRQGRPAAVSAAVTVSECAACAGRVFCPTVGVSCPDRINDGDATTFTADVRGGDESIPATYNWSVSAGTIMSGQGTPSITVNTNGLGRQTLTATVRVGGYPPECNMSGSCSVSVAGPLNPPQTPGTLKGTVRDRNGAPVAGATVLIAGKITDTAVTDRDGNYVFTNLPPGQYLVKIIQGNPAGQPDSSVGGWRNVTVEPGGTVTLTIDNPFGIPDITPTPDAGPSPQASPTPSPTPEATPTSSPTLATTTTVQVIKQDQIKVTYLNRFLKGDEGRVTFELKEVIGKVDPTTTTVNTSTQVTTTPDPFTGARPGTVRPEVNPDAYLIYVRVGLRADRLEAVSPPDNAWRLYTGKQEFWEWKLRPLENMAEGTEFPLQFKVDVRWQPKTPGAPPIENEDVWRNEFTVRIGPPASRVMAAAYGSPVLAALGLVTFGTGFRKRKDLLGASLEEDEAEIEEDVSGTVYAPSEAAPGDGFLVQVFIHLPEQAASLDEIAREADEDARRRITSRLQKKIKRGTELTFYLLMPGLEVDQPSQSCVWKGEPDFVQFGVTVPEDCKPKTIFGTVAVIENSVPIGHLKFKFRITDGATPEADASRSEPAPVGNMTRYQQAFISYTSKDRPEVLKRVQMLNLTKIKFFQDLLTLEAGDQWEEQIYEYINKSDVFFLFWSKAASESTWVRREVEYALKRKAGQEEAAPEIIPVIIEGPPPAPPPQELSFLHFNDRLIYFINPRESPPGQG
jgi:hypothetical protein